MKGSKVLITEEPRGRIKAGIISGALLPGTIVQQTTAPDGNSLATWGVYNRSADGNRPAGPIAVLLERGEGYTYATAYTSGYHCEVYIPLPGDELNVLWSASGTGTGDSVAFGDLAIVDDGTGLLVDTTGTPESEPFMAMEAVSDVVSAGTMVWSMFTGY